MPLRSTQLPQYNQLAFRLRAAMRSKVTRTQTHDNHFSYIDFDSMLWLTENIGTESNFRELVKLYDWIPLGHGANFDSHSDVNRRLAQDLWDGEPHHMLDEVECEPFFPFPMTDMWGLERKEAPLMDRSLVVSCSHGRLIL